MTTDEPSNASRAPWQTTAALVSGLASLIALVIFLAVSAGSTPLLIAALLGALAIVLGIVGIRGSRTKGKAIAGIITGAFSLLISAAIYIFALLFIGAIAI